MNSENGPADYSTLNADVAELRRRMDSLVLDLKSLGLDIEVAAEEYGLTKAPDGSMTRTVNFSFTVWHREIWTPP